MTDTERQLLLIVASWIADYEEANGAALDVTSTVSEQIKALLKQVQPDAG